MSSAAVASKPRLKPRRPRGPAPWWGQGAAPHLRWPGATIEIPAVWSKRRERWESPDALYYFDVEAAERACDFFPTFLVHGQGEFAGEPFDLLEWQRVVTRAIFGWMRARDALRRFRKVLVFVAKGNGKSPWGAGVGLFLVLCDGEAGAEVYAVAADKEQARVVHNEAKAMVEASADLAELTTVLRDSIYCPRSRSSYLVVSADAKTKHGRRPHGVIIDELHAQPNRDLFEAFERSMVKRRQPLTVMLSHAGDDDEGICYEEYEHAQALIAGTLRDDTYFPLVFEAAQGDDWTSPKTWAKANPALGITVNKDTLAHACETAQHEPRKRNAFEQFNLNRWTNQATAWLPIDWFDACPAVLPTDATLAALECCAGLDLAQKIDLASLSLVFRGALATEGDTALDVEVSLDPRDASAAEAPNLVRNLSLNWHPIVVTLFWMPEAMAAERKRQDRVPYPDWASRGWVKLTEGTVIDDEQIYRDVLGLARRFPRLKQGEIGYDPAFATSLALRLRDAGFKMVEVPQNYQHLNEPAHALEAFLRAGRFTHDGNRLLRWCFENVAVKRDDSGRIRPVKPRGNKRIDGVVAALMGISRLLVAPAPKEIDMTITVLG